MFFPPLLRRPAGVVLLALCCVLFPALSGQAGTLINEDEAAYAYKLYWDDLQPVENATIGPGGTAVFRESRGIVELVGQNDNIYVKQGEVLHIRDGILVRK